MEGFTLGLALVDAIPVLSFGISMVILAGRFDSPLFMIGAVLSVLAGCCKVAWKLVLGIAKRDLRWLNRPFLPMQITGFGFILGSVLTSLTRIDWPGVLNAVTGFPSIGLYGLVPQAQIQSDRCPRQLDSPDRQRNRSDLPAAGYFVRRIASVLW